MSVIDAGTSRRGEFDEHSGSRGRALLGSLSRADVILSGLLGLTMVGLFYRWIIKQFGPSGFSALRFEDWGHAYFVPLISGFYIWKNREILSRVRVQPYWPGVTLLPLAVVTYVYFILNFPNHMFQGAAFVLAVAGVVLFLGGPVVLRALAFPIGYLLLAVTISEAVMNGITWQLKIIASKGSHLMLNMVGVETDIQGNILQIHQGTNTYPLNVADACSGMRMVVAFIALGAAVAFFASGEWWKRIAIIATAVPVAIFMNIVRVVVLGVLTLVNPELATGEAHTFIGTLLLVPAFLLFMGFVKIFDKVLEPSPEPTETRAPEAVKPTASGTPRGGGQDA